MGRKAKKDFIIDTFYVAIIIFLVFLVSFILFKYLLPFVIGGIIAFTIQKPSDYLSRKINIKKGVLAAVLSVLVYVLTFGVLVLLVYRLVRFSIGFVDRLPDLLEKFVAIFNTIEIKYSDIFSLLPSEFSFASNRVLDNTLALIFEKFGSAISSFVSDIIKSTPSFFISSIVTLVATCYIAKDYGGLIKFLKNFLGEKISGRTAKIKKIFVGSVLKIIKGYLILLVITFLELYLGFLIIGVEYSFVLAVLIALMDLLPVIGTGTVMVPWAVISALVGNVKFGISLAVLYIVILMVRNFLEPKIIAKQIGINSLFTLTFMFLGLKVLGFWGLILFPVIFIVTIKYYKSEMEEGLSV